LRFLGFLIRSGHPTVASARKSPEIERPHYNSRSEPRGVAQLRLNETITPNSALCSKMMTIGITKFRLLGHHDAGGNVHVRPPVVQVRTRVMSVVAEADVAAVGGRGDDLSVPVDQHDLISEVPEKPDPTVYWVVSFDSSVTVTE